MKTATRKRSRRAKDVVPEQAPPPAQFHLCDLLPRDCWLVLLSVGDFLLHHIERLALTTKSARVFVRQATTKTLFIPEIVPFACLTSRDLFAGPHFANLDTLVIGNLSLAFGRPLFGFDRLYRNTILEVLCQLPNLRKLTCSALILGRWCEYTRRPHIVLQRLEELHVDLCRSIMLEYPIVTYSSPAQLPPNVGLNLSTLVWEHSSPLVDMPALRHLDSNIHCDFVVNTTLASQPLRIFSLAVCMFNSPALLRRLTTARFCHPLKVTIPMLVNVERLVLCSVSRPYICLARELESLPRLIDLQVSPMLVRALHQAKFSRMHLVSRTDATDDCLALRDSVAWSDDIENEFLSKMQRVACPLSSLLRVSQVCAATLVRLELRDRDGAMFAPSDVLTRFAYPSLLELVVEGIWDAEGTVSMPRLLRLGLADVTYRMLKLFSTVTTLESVMLGYLSKIQDIDTDANKVRARLALALTTLPWNRLLTLYVSVHGATDEAALLETTIDSLDLQSVTTFACISEKADVFRVVADRLDQMPVLRRLLVGGTENLLSITTTRALIVHAPALEYAIFIGEYTDDFFTVCNCIIQHTTANTLVIHHSNTDYDAYNRQFGIRRHAFFRDFITCVIRAP